MKQAVITCIGKQYLVHAGSRLTVDRVAGEVGDSIEFPVLLTFEGDGNVSVGKPQLSGTAKAKITVQGRAKKLTVIKFKRKVRYRRKHGYRHLTTTLEITSV
ncbi:MAG: 50S ribosomal protein L21 [bacterium]|nr:50S ribosomal protein L21 [bacterium]